MELRDSQQSSHPEVEHDANFKCAWLKEAKEKIGASGQWRRLSRDIYHGVQKQLEENRIQYFSDLGKEERLILIDEVQASIKQTPAYRNFHHRLSDILDSCLAETVDSTLRTQECRKSSSELVVEEASCAILELADVLPKERFLTDLFLNQEIPQVLRPRVWAQLLADSEAKDSYKKKVSSRGSLATIARIDAEIVTRCKAVISQHFLDLSDADAVCMVAKTALSYLHAASICIELESMYLPAVLVSIVYSRKGGNASSIDKVSHVVEALCALRARQQPRVTLGTVGEHSRFLQDLARALTTHDAELADHFSLCAEKEGITDAKMTSMVFHPLLENQLVDILDPTACLYVWDQCLILSFHVALPKFAVAILLCLRGRLKECQNGSEIKDVILSHGKSVTTTELIHKMENTFMPLLRQHRNSPLRNLSVWNQQCDEDDGETEVEVFLSHRRKDSAKRVMEDSAPQELKSTEQVKEELEARAISQIQPVLQQSETVVAGEAQADSPDKEPCKGANDIVTKTIRALRNMGMNE